MAMYVTDEYVKELVYFTTLSAAYKLGIKDAERKSLAALHLDIQTRNSHVATALDAYIRAYRQWYALHLRIDAEEKQGKLSPQENDELLSHIEEREGTRAELVKALAAVG